MPNQVAILVGALIIALAIFFRSEPGRYDIASAPNAEGGGFAWRVDTRTGEVVMCFPDVSNAALRSKGGPFPANCASR